MPATTVDRSSERIKRHLAMQAEAMRLNVGDRSTTQWRAAATDRVVQMVNRSPRSELLNIDMFGELQITCRIVMPVPRKPCDGKLVVGDHVVFNLNYRDEWRIKDPPGIGPLGVLYPLDIFHPNARTMMRGALCLGNKSLTAGIEPKEIFLMGYHLVALQDYTLDELDPEGVLDQQACEYFRCHPEYLPLTSAGLNDDWTPERKDL